MTTLSHYAIATAHMDDTLYFYCRYGSMRIVRDRRQGTRICWLAPDKSASPILVIIDYPDIPYAAEGSDSMLRHLGFELESKEEVDSMYHLLKAENRHPTNPVYVDEFTGYITMVKDPDGRWVEFSYGQDVSESNWDLPHS